MPEKWCCWSTASPDWPAPPASAELYDRLEDGDALRLDPLPPLSAFAAAELERHQSLLPPQPLVDDASWGDDGLGEDDRGPQFGLKSPS